jgi:acyl-CoA synthetase (AMP-forming)/AMP-acid ligase II
VALLMPKSPACMGAMFGALKADCIYVPIDTASPRHRIERILAQCECRCVVADLASSRLLYELMASDAWQHSTSVIWLVGGV